MRGGGLKVGLAGRARRIAGQGRASTRFEGIVKGTADAQELGLFLGLDEILTQYAAGGTYASNGAGALSAVSTSPGGHGRVEGGGGWIAGEGTLFHGTVEGPCLLEYGIAVAILVRKGVPATTPLPVLFTWR